MAEPSTRGDWFPKTRWSAIRDAVDPASPTRSRSLEEVAATYWRPVYAYLRRKWGRSHEDARDLTQDFFVALCEKDFLEKLDPGRGRFRAYLMAALDNFTRMNHRWQSRQKRGGGVGHVPIEIGEGFEPAFGDSPEQVFLREWARSILEGALREMEAHYRARGQESHYRVFAAYDLERGPGEKASYEALAGRFRLGLSDVKNILYAARVKLREIVLAKVRDTVTTDDEAAAEMRELFGAEP